MLALPETYAMLMQTAIVSVGVALSLIYFSTI